MEVLILYLWATLPKISSALTFVAIAAAVTAFVCWAVIFFEAANDYLSDKWAAQWMRAGKSAVYVFVFSLTINALLPDRTGLAAIVIGKMAMGTARSEAASEAASLLRDWAMKELREAAQKGKQ